MARVVSRLSSLLFSITVFLPSLILLIQAGTPVCAAEPKPECWAAIIGISDYQSVSDLSFSDDDARDLSAALSPVWGADHIKLLIDKEATKEKVRGAVSWLADKSDTDDTVLFYFAGHGDKDGYLAPYDAYYEDTWISSTELANWFKSLRAGKTVIILETCHAGEYETALSTNGRVIMLSCRSDEDAWETTRFNHSVFTYFILEALKHFNACDANHDYELSAEEISRYSTAKTSEWRGTKQQTQNPVIADHYPGELGLLSEFVFSIKPSLPPGTPVLMLDNKTYSSVPPPQIWLPGSSHTLKVPQLIPQGTNTRYVFTAWNDGNSTAERTVLFGAYTANYSREHQLLVNSVYGEPKGSGWYKEGETASISVPPSIEEPATKRIFTGWSGSLTSDKPTTPVIMDSPKTVTANWRNEYLLTVTSLYGETGGAGWYQEGATATISVQPSIEGPTIKHTFSGWSGGSTSDKPTAPVAMNSPKTVTANWRNEYLLTVTSLYGETGGAGWYQENGTATVSVTPPIKGVIVRHIFNGWSGDFSAATASAALNMDSPKAVTATWRTDYTRLYILVAVLLVLIMTPAIVLLIRRRR